jgi:Tol biopolymer transport system component
MKHLSILKRKAGFVIITLLLSLTSCEKKEDYGRLLYTSDDPMGSLFWSESSDEVFYTVETGYYNKPLYVIDINTKNSRKIADIATNYGNSIFQKDNKIYYFNDAEYNNVKLYSVNVSGSAPQLIIDSMQTPVFSRKYIAFTRTFTTDTTFTYKTILYDLETGTETAINGESLYMPAAISPDGSRVLLRSFDEDSSNNFFSIYDTGTGQLTSLPVTNQYYDLFRFFWIDNEVYGFRGSYSGIDILNIKTGVKLNLSETLDYSHSYVLSPSGKMLAYVIAEEPAMASGIVGSHYFLHIINTGTSAKTIIDLKRDYVYEGTVTFSPDDTRIAYIRDYFDIYLVSL